jgi:hypothetical protein
MTAASGRFRMPGLTWSKQSSGLPKQAAREPGLPKVIRLMTIDLAKTV